MDRERTAISWRIVQQVDSLGTYLARCKYLFRLGDARISHFLKYISLWAWVRVNILHLLGFLIRFFIIKNINTLQKSPKTFISTVKYNINFFSNWNNDFLRVGGFNSLNIWYMLDVENSKIQRTILYIEEIQVIKKNRNTILEKILYQHYFQLDLLHGKFFICFV